MVRRVLQKIDPLDPKDALHALVEAGAPADTPMWRRVLVENHRLLESCHQQMLRFVPGQTVYLLTQRQRNGYHVDLFVYALYGYVLLAQDRHGFRGFAKPDPPWVKGHRPSTLRLGRNGSIKATIEVTTWTMQSHFEVLHATDRYTGAFTQAGWVRQEGRWRRTVPLQRGKEVLHEAARILTGH